MPRIISSASFPVDFCLDCFPDEDEAEEIYGDVGDGPDDRGNCYDYKADHPPYEQESYRCDTCRKPLDSEDD